MDTSKNPIEVLNLVNSILQHINLMNFNKMSQKIVSIPIKTVDLFENIVDIIHARALNQKHLVGIYARLCVYLVNSKSFNKPQNCKTTFQKVLTQKSYDLFMSHVAPQNDIDKIKEEFKKSCMTRSNFMEALNDFFCQLYSRSQTNCEFIAALYKQGVFTKRFILSCITKLMTETDDLKTHCLCIILKIAGPKLSKNHNMDRIVNHILSFKNENSTFTEMSSTLYFLIIKVQKMHLNGWRNEEPEELIKSNVNTVLFESLPEELKNLYELKSYNVMAQYIVDECLEVLKHFNEKKNISEVIGMLDNTNSWLWSDQLSFVATLIVITLSEPQIIRLNAGILLDKLVVEGLLSSDSVKFGVENLLDDSEMKIAFSELSNLVADITGGLTSLDMISV